MLILISISLVAIPLIAILYPFLHIRNLGQVLDSEDDLREDFVRRWDVALTGLRNAELERAIGTLGENDYSELHDHYITEASIALKILDLEAFKEAELMASIDQDMKKIREGFLGPDSSKSTSDDLPGDNRV